MARAEVGPNLGIVVDMAGSVGEADERYSVWGSKKYPKILRTWDEYLRFVKNNQFIRDDETSVSYLNVREVIEVFEALQFRNKAIY